MPDLVALARGNSRLAIVAIGSENPEANREFAEEFSTPFPFASQPNLWLSSRYRVRSTPFVMYVDDGGVVRAKGIVNRLSQVEQLVERGEKLSPPRSVPTEGTTQEVNP
jgi:peroxiredoxin